MIKRNQAALFFSLIALSMVLAGSAAAGGGSATLTGSWESVAVLDGTAGDAPALFTFNADGTFTATGPTVANSTAHGAWKQTGSRTFQASNVSFIYGPTGEVSGTIITNSTLTVASDGQTYDVVFDGETRLGDGTVLPFSGTGVASRINVAGCDGDSDSDSDSDSD